MMERYQRQYILSGIGEEGQQKLLSSNIAIVGVGALGSISSELLVRAGIGKITLIDRDFVEISNLQRQGLFTEEDAKFIHPKAIAAQKHLKKINSDIEIETIVDDLNVDNISNYLTRADLIIDGCDNYETRYLLNDYSRKNKKPFIYGGVVRSEGKAFVSIPNGEYCLRCLFPEMPTENHVETCDQVGVLSTASHMVACFQVTEALKILCGRLDEVEKRLISFDIWKNDFRYLDPSDFVSEKCSGCKKSDFPFLKPSSGTKFIKLCGRNAVQIVNSERREYSLERMAKKLEKQGEITFNDFLLCLKTRDFELNLFKNGRAIVKGTEDTTRAKSIYSQYIGN